MVNDAPSGAHYHVYRLTGHMPEPYAPARPD